MSFTQLKGITQIGNSENCDQLKSNLVSFFDWGFLGIGGFTNVSGVASGAYGGSFDRLYPRNDPNYSAGRVWSGPRQNWVWETGVEYAAVTPIKCSGVTVNGNFYPTASTTGTYAHTINFPQGTVIFNSGIPLTGVVTANYAYKSVNFVTSDVAWFKQIMTYSQRPDDIHNMQIGSGAWDILSSNRVQLPCVVVESVPRRKYIPMQLGGGQYVQQDCLFHIVSETPFDRDQILDIISNQKEKTIWAYNNSTIPPPLNHAGYPVSGYLVYKDLVSESGGYRWNRIRFVDFQLQATDDKPPIYGAIIRGTFEIPRADI